MVAAIDNIFAFATDINNILIFSAIMIGFVLLAGLGLGGLAIVINTRWKPVKFLVITRERTRFITQRLIGDQITNLSFLDLFFGRQTEGEDIKAFTPYSFSGGLLSGPQTVYLATIEKGMLIPLETKWEYMEGKVWKPYINPEKIIEGKVVARRFISAWEMARTMAKVQEPLIAQFMLWLPLAVILGLYLLGNAWAFSYVLSVISGAASDLKTASELLVEFSKTLPQASGTTVVNVGGQ